MMGLLDQRLILADQDGRVISDTAGLGVGNTLAVSDLSNGTVIESGGQFLGTIVVTPHLLSVDSPAAEFLNSVNRGIVTSVGVAALVALLMGALLFTQIAAPLQRLKTAANEIAQGNLDHHIDIQTQDEFGELAQSFNQMASSLARLETQRQQMVSDVAHELRTPLAAIQCILEGVEDGVLPMDAEQIAALQAETTLLNRLVGDLRVLSLVDAGQLKLEKTRTDPAAFLQTTVERLRIQAEQKDIQLDFEAQDGLPDVFLDQDRIAQVIVNLISNALRYTPNGGRILVKIISETDSTLQISVTDSGIGIEAQALPYVFERFYRADKSRTRASGGSGLGLAIVKQLVEAHGGRVTAESPIFASPDGSGYGTRVSFYLPLSGEAKVNIATGPRRSLNNPKRW